MVPWPQPQWMFDPSRRTLFYPDLDEQPDDICQELAASRLAAACVRQFRPEPVTRGYGTSLGDMALIQLAMPPRLPDEDASLDALIPDLLAPGPTDRGAGRSPAGGQEITR